MTNVNIINPFKGVTGNKGGGINILGSYILQSGTTDNILLSGFTDFILQSGTTDNILLSSNTCNDFILQSGTTDNILLSGTTDKILTTGTCTSKINDVKWISSIGSCKIR